MRDRTGRQGGARDHSLRCGAQPRPRACRPLWM